MSPKARATGGETLDSPLRIEYNYASDDEHSKRKAFTQALKNPKKLFRDRKPAKKVPSFSSGARQTSNAGTESTISLNAIASDGASTPVLETRASKHSLAEQTSTSKLINIETVGNNQGLEENEPFMAQKRKQSQDHVEGTARSVSKSRTETEIQPKIPEPTSIGKDEVLRTNSPLQTWFEANRHSPYPNEEEREWLASQSGRTIQQISTWFHHKRSRLKSLQRAGHTENAVIEWMDGVNADGSMQDSTISKDSIAETPPSKVWFAAILKEHPANALRSAGVRRVSYLIFLSKTRTTSRRLPVITLARHQPLNNRTRNKLHASEILRPANEIRQ
jgi:hypothetical protein